MEKRRFRLGIKMNLDDRKNQVPEEFKILAKDFSDNGFITTSFENLINWSRTGALDDFWSCLLCCSNDANINAKI